MIKPLTQEEFIKLKNLIATTCGISLDDDKKYLIETRLTAIGNDLQAKTFTDLHNMILADKKKLLPMIIDTMTTNETFWFRDENTWVLLKDVIIPEYILLLKQTKRPIRIWSAAASTGQEAYSLSMLIKECTEKANCPELFNSFSIIGTDISNEALHIAKNAVYNQISIRRGLSDERLKRFFKQENLKYILAGEIKKIVEFKYFNLLDSFKPLGIFDLILCRNIAIYFSQDFKTELFKKIADCLNIKGTLILGATETLYGQSKDFEAIPDKKCFYYRLQKGEK